MVVGPPADSTDFSVWSSNVALRVRVLCLPGQHGQIDYPA